MRSPKWPPDQNNNLFKLINNKRIMQEEETKEKTELIIVPNSYNVTAKETSSGKVSNITPVIIKPLVTNTFTTTWDNNTPNIDQNIIFDGDFNVSTDITACSCTVNPGRNVVVSPSNTLTITNQVTVLGSGTLTFNSTASDNSSNPISNSGSLVQTNDTPLVANSGAIT